MTTVADPVALPKGDLTAAVTVESTMWGRFQGAIRCAGFVLRAVPAGPTQPPRYLLLDGMSRSNGELTDRELEVLSGISNGLSNVDIARELHVTCDTVKTHVSRLFKKLGVADRSHAVAVAFRAGMLS